VDDQFVYVPSTTASTVQGDGRQYVRIQRHRSHSHQARRSRLAVDATMGSPTSRATRAPGTRPQFSDKKTGAGRADPSAAERATVTGVRGIAPTREPDLDRGVGRCHAATRSSPKAGHG